MKTRKLVIPKIAGGLGNQMFQYAFARTIAEKYGGELALDIFNLGTHELSMYGLNHFFIQENYATRAEVARFARHKRKKGLLGRLYNPFFADPRLYIAEKTSTYSTDLAATNPPCYLEGYWLSEKYFLECKDIIRKEFTLRTPLTIYSADIAQRIEAEPESISFHIRRGFLKDGASLGLTPEQHSHMVCPPEYYAEAMRIMNERVPNGSYFVFSDDPEWARENIHTGRPTMYIGQGAAKNYEDIELMRLCKHHIISNSTFGWWGAWLSENERKNTITIAPSKWLTKPFDTKDLIPERWITLPY